MDEEPHASSVCCSGPGGLGSHRLRFLQTFFSLSLSHSLTGPLMGTSSDGALRKKCPLRRIKKKVV